MQQSKSGLGLGPTVIIILLALWLANSSGGTITAEKRAKVLATLGVYSDPSVIVFTSPG
ncbi:MAG: hypothetical protein ABFD96_06220 [Armatimonadia bacterium]